MLLRHAPLGLLAVLALTVAGCGSKTTETKSAESKPAAPVAEAPSAPTHVVAGEVRAVDPSGKRLTVGTPDGKQHEIQIEDHTSHQSLKHGAEQMGKGAVELAKASGDKLKQGTQVVVRYTEKEGRLIGHQVHHAADVTVEKTEVVVQRVEEGGRKVVVKTKDGAEQVYEVSKKTTLAAGDKIVEVGETAGQKIETGAKATIHWTEDAGRKVAHLFQK